MLKNKFFCVYGHKAIMEDDSSLSYLVFEITMVEIHGLHRIKVNSMVIIIRFNLVNLQKFILISISMVYMVSLCTFWTYIKINKSTKFFQVWIYLLFTDEYIRITKQKKHFYLKRIVHELNFFRFLKIPCYKSNLL